VLKALEKNPEDRYQSAGTLAEDIRNYLCGKPTVAIPRTEREKNILEWAKGAAGATLAFLLPLLILWIGVAVYYRAWPTRLRPSPEPVPQPIDPEVVGEHAIDNLRNVLAQAESATTARRRVQLSQDARALVRPIAFDLSLSDPEVWELVARTAILCKDSEMALLASEALARLHGNAKLIEKLAPLIDPGDLRVWKEHRPGFLQIETRAKSGDGAAMGELAEAYLDGPYGFPSDDAEALRWSRAGAAAGDGLSMCNMGVMAQSRRAGVEGGIEAAIGWFEEGAKAGNGRAMSFLGSIYADGPEGRQRDPSKSKDLFQQGAKAGSPRAMTCLGVMCEDGGEGLNPDDAVEWYRQAAAGGDPAGMFHLGSAYLRGRPRGVDKNEGEAVRWFNKAAAAGDAEAMRTLGSMYEHGDAGLPPNHEEAVGWYRRAARRGDPVAPIWLKERNLTW